jgi:hypothetical protein
MNIFVHLTKFGSGTTKTESTKMVNEGKLNRANRARPSIDERSIRNSRRNGHPMKGSGIGLLQVPTMV